MYQTASKLLLLISLIMACVLAVSCLASSNMTYNWSYKPEKDNKPVTTEPYFLEMLEKSNGFFIGDTSKKELYLTFDNGYENGLYREGT